MAKRDGMKNGTGLPQSDGPAVGDKIAMPPGVFVAIDLETADYCMDSACALGAVRVEDGMVTAEEYRLFRPPSGKDKSTVTGDIDWQALKDHPAFQEVWPGLAELLDGADYIIAHNANFDKTIIATSCKTAATNPPDSPFLCTLKGAKSLFGKGSYPLAELCQRFSIPLRHQNALADAKAAMQVCSELCANGALLSAMHVDPIAVEALGLGDDEPAAKPATEKEALDEFRTIALSLTCDDVLTNGEFDFICRWLAKHEPLTSSSSFAPIFDMAAKILEDGIAGEKELEEMKKLLATV